MKKEKVKEPFALLINDIHVSKDNIPEFQANWNEALEICEKLGIENLIVGGDLWQARSAQTLSTLMAVRQAIIKAANKGINLTIAEGNHDKVDQESMLGYSHLFSEYPHVVVTDDWSIVEIDHDNQVALYVMSYFPENGSFISKLEEVVRYLKSSWHNILYIHQGIRGGLSQPSEDELPADIFSEFDAVLVGHYHDRKKIKGTNIEYIGASRQHNFGEDEEKGYTVLYTDGSYDFIQNRANMRYKVMEIEAIDINSDVLDEIEDIKAEGRYRVKVKVNCTDKEAANFAMTKQALIDAGAMRVEVVNEEVAVTSSESQSLDSKYDKNGIKREYSEYCSDNEISVDLGLQYLDKIN